MEKVLTVVLLVLLVDHNVDSCISYRYSRPVTRSTDSAPPAFQFQRIKGRQKLLVDEFGRERIFHGFNSVQKGPPWYDPQILNMTRLQYYKEWGFNAVRLGTMWSGVQPSRNTYNHTYINLLKTIMTQLKNHGMYTLMDMHQDILTSKYNAYDGIPRWLIDSYPAPEHPFPWPLNGHYGNGDFRGYLTQAVSEGFQYFYDNYNHSRDLFMNFWKLLATVFKNDKNVLGYELINEPWCGDIYRNPQLLLPGIAGERNLVPLYEFTHQAIRTIDNETLVFYEPVTWGVVLRGEIVGTGFSSVPGGPAYRNRTVLSWHYYCWIIGLDPAAFRKNDTLIQKLICDKLLAPQIFDSVNNDLDTLNGPGFLTEFGNCHPDCNKCSVNTVECDFIMNFADQHKVSWTYWISKFWLDNGDVNWPTVRAFARAYPQATQGEITKFNFDVNTGSFQMTYIINTKIPAPTEIFLPKLHYPNGHNVTATTGLKWTFDPAISILKVQPSPGLESRMNGIKAFINIKPKAETTTKVQYIRQPWYHTVWEKIHDYASSKL